ncbi:hypothetical protein B0H16DRAFT_1721175 [Mycena metata]|uniref:Uncharacterized protein n=1 Tax=Mycena metata TaxID=1033252 RepID=A0AAD7NFI5_9AGAR|nr:hypothetical protein B0H16DRAFT_1721175 [Mycena metata]
MSDDEPEAGTFTYRTARFIDNSFRIDGEMSHQSTVTGDRGIFISDDGERQAETLRNITYKRRRLCLRPNKLNDSLAEWIPVAADGDDEIAEELRATMDGISGSGNARKRKSYLSSVGLTNETSPPLF